tara:strand:- start:206 stop:1102 length:897 start_codon:yes stop_codon:yes gene_type:complete
MFNKDVLNFHVEKFDLGAFNLNFGGVDGGKIDPSLGVGLRRSDTKEPIAIVSDSYEPVQYLALVENLEQSISMSGIDLDGADFETNLIGNGEQLELTAKFNAEATTIDGRNDTVIPQFKFRTSHNRTWANNGMMGYFRSACYNTLVDGNKLAYVYGRHSKNFSVSSFASKIRAASDFIANDGMDQMKMWYNTPVYRDQAISLFSNTLAKRMDNVTKAQVPNKVMLSNLMKTFDEENRHIIGQGNYEKYAQRTEGTLWTAYQAATAWSTHVPKENTRVLREDRVRKMMDSPHWKRLETV